MLVLAALFLVGVIVEFYAVVAAPFGYQDDSGFHTGFERPGEGSRHARNNPK
jgi:hypothetical protein